MPLPLDRVRSRLKRKNIDALLVTQPENRRYLSGFSATDHSINESSGVLLILREGRSLLLTDFRYELQARQEAAGYETVLYKKGLLPLLEKMLPSLGVKSLAFEGHSFLHRDALKLQGIAERLGISLLDGGKYIETLREEKEAWEIEKIEKSLRLNEAVFQEIHQRLAPGMTERQVAGEIEYLMRRKGADGPSFDTIVASGPNGALPHAVPTDRPIREGEPIIIDMGVKLGGYCSDMTRTVVLGKMDDKTAGMIRLVRKAQKAAIGKIRAGVECAKIDGFARRTIADAGLGDRFGHGLGHGVGLAVHEAPRLNRRSRKKLAAGMVVTVEPGVYVPEWGGVRLENMVAVEKGGSRVLNRDTTFLDV